MLVLGSWSLGAVCSRFSSRMDTQTVDAHICGSCGNVNSRVITESEVRVRTHHSADVIWPLTVGARGGVDDDASKSLRPSQEIARQLAHAHLCAAVRLRACVNWRVDAQRRRRELTLSCIARTAPTDDVLRETENVCPSNRTNPYTHTHTDIGDVQRQSA